MNNKCFIRTGLNEFQASPNIAVNDIHTGKPIEGDDWSDKSSESENPYAEKEPEVTAYPEPSGEKKTGAALGGYEKVNVEKGNSQIIDKTPENSELNDPSKLKNDEPTIEEDEHPHQIENGEVEKSHELEKNTNSPSDLGTDKPEIKSAGMPEDETPEPESNTDFISIATLQEETDPEKMEDEGCKCTGCGKLLPSNYPYPTCNGCESKKGKKKDSWIGEETKKECKSCGCGQLNTKHDKIHKLQSLKEAYAKKPFLTMKQVLLLNEVNKLLKCIK